MARNKTDKAWMREHVTDPFVQKAKRHGMRSRAAYKLEEVCDRDRLIAPGMTVVDLGAAPGGWSQMVRSRIGEAGRVIALDILPMQGIAGVDFIEGDFRADEVLKSLEKHLDGASVDLVLSDMAPNLSGMSSVDQPRAMHLAELAEAFAGAHLRTGGAFLTKLFQGEGFDAYVRRLRQGYGRVSMRKPKASRARSPEVYALAIGKKA